MNTNDIGEIISAGSQGEGDCPRVLGNMPTQMNADLNDARENSPGRRVGDFKVCEIKIRSTELRERSGRTVRKTAMEG